MRLREEERPSASRLSQRYRQHKHRQQHHRASSSSSNDNNNHIGRTSGRVSASSSKGNKRRPRRSGGSSGRRMNGNAMDIDSGSGSGSGNSCSTCDMERGEGAEGRLKEATLEQMHQVVHDIRILWSEWDRGTGGFEVTFEIREKRERFGALVEQWFECRGKDDMVREMVTYVGDMDVRIAALDAMAQGEIKQWEMDAAELRERWEEENSKRYNQMNGRAGVAGDGSRAGTGLEELGGLAGVATCANDMIIELAIYRTTHQRMLSSDQKNQLECVAQNLQSVVDLYKKLEKRMRTKRDREDLYAAYSTFSRRGPFDFHCDPGPSASSGIGSYEEFIQNNDHTNHQTYADPPAASPYTSHSSAEPSHQSTPRSSFDETEAKRRKPKPSSQSTRIAAEKVAPTRSALHERPSATLGRRRPKLDDPEHPYDQLPSSPRAPPPGPNNQNGQMVPPQSFSSSLYQTVHRRQSSVQDLGSVLRPSRVKGDGRCMFRAVAKSRAAATGQLAGWSDDIERDVADLLRAKVCDALLDHRELFINYCVVEGDFDTYVKRMRSSKRYGGEPELLMLARILHVPISVYMGDARNYRRVQVYGKIYQGTPVHILLQGVHYDCLLPKQHQRQRVYTHLSQYRDYARNWTPGDSLRKPPGTSSSKGRKVSSDYKRKRK